MQNYKELDRCSVLAALSGLQSHGIGSNPQRKWTSEVIESDILLKALHLGEDVFHVTFLEGRLRSKRMEVGKYPSFAI